MWQLANPWMLLGLAGLAIPVLVHLLNRRRNVVVEWGAMQFLELGRRARRRIELTDTALMLGRMAILGLVALALARPSWMARPAPGSVAPTPAGRSAPRDVVLVIDGSESMGRRGGGTTPWSLARNSASALLAELPAGSAADVIVARGRPRALANALGPDHAALARSLAELPEPAGSADLPAAVAEALRLLETGENTDQAIIILGDPQRAAWRLDRPRAWELLRDLRAQQARRTGKQVGLWAVTCDVPAEGTDGAVSAIELSPARSQPLRTVRVRATVVNAGPGPLTRRVTLLLDDAPVPGAAQDVGPLPPGGSTVLTFETRLAEPGLHVLAVALDPDADPLAANDRGEAAAEVVGSIPLLLVDGEPGLEPLTGEVDFARAALAPRGQASPPVELEVVTPDALQPAAFELPQVLVMANVVRLEPAIASALARRVAEGAGLLIAPGRHVDAAWWNAQPWLPARLEIWQSVEAAGTQPPHPAPASFQGERLAPLAAGTAPPLSGVALLGAWRLAPDGEKAGVAVLARLDNGDPWIVERPLGRGRVILLAGPLDAEGGTLPVNPDFVPLLHELVTLLATPGSAATTIRTGEPLVVELDAKLPDEVAEASIQTPDGQTQRVPLDRGGGRVRLRYDATDRPGVYQVNVAGRPRFGVTARTDPLEADPAPLARTDRDRLSADWPLRFLDSPAELGPALLSTGSAAGPRPLWRWLVLAALGGLCFEVYVTRRLASRRGVAGPDAFFD